MLRHYDDWEAHSFAFRADHGPQSLTKAAVPVEHVADGASVTISDAHLLFSAEFARAGTDLVLHGEDGASFVVHNYFAGDHRARLLSPDGATLSPEVVAALVGPLAPGQYAQAGAATPAAAAAIGRVAHVDGNVTIVRNGVAVTPHTGDAILKGDVLQTGAGELGVTFNDGSTLNLTANSRMLVNEFVYDPNSNANSQILDLVQGSLTFISGEVAHHGNMRIGTPVATMGIRGTVGGITTASDGTVHFYVSQSATGAVIIDSRDNVIAQVVQNGPLIVVRPAGPQQVLAEEVQKSPQQLAVELAALQHIVSIQSVGQQIIQQFLQQDPNNPNPQSSDRPHTQIQIDLHTNNSGSNDSGSGNNQTTPGSAIVTITTPSSNNGGTDIVEEIIIPIPVNLAPVNFGPLQQEIDEDDALVFSASNANAISVFDSDTAVLTVTLTATHGVLSLSGIAGLSFSAGDGTSDATMTFSGSQAAINVALNGLTFAPDQDYNGQASVQVITGDGNSTATETVAITISPVNDAPVLSLSHSEYAEDRFNSQAYNLNTGSVNWATNWIEANDGASDQATTGELQVANDPTVTGGNPVLKLSDLDSEVGVPDTVQRTVNLTGAVSAILTFDYRRDIPNGQSNDLFPVLISTDGISFTQIGVFGGSSVVDASYQTFSFDISSYISAATIIRFSVGDGVDNGDVVYVDNVKISYVASSTNYDLKYVENGAGVAISSTGNQITDTDDTHIQSATITLTNRQSGDRLVMVGSLPGVITASAYNANTGVLTLTGNATLADYQTALHQVEFSSTSENPNTTDRVINVTVNDGTSDSNTASTTIHVTAVNDAPVAADDSVITNVAANTSFALPDWVLTLHDNDSENDALTITGVSNNSAGTTVSHASVTTTFSSTSGAGTFDYTLSDGALADTGHVTVTHVTTTDVEGTDNADILVGDAAGTLIAGKMGSDVLIGNGGSDTFVFHSNFGNDTVADYTPGTDILQFDQADFADVAALLAATSDNGSGYAVITHDAANTVTLFGVDLATLLSNQSDIHIV